MIAAVALSSLVGAVVSFAVLAVLYPLPRIILAGLLLAVAIEASPLLIAPALSKHRKRGRVKAWLDEEL